VSDGAARFLSPDEVEWEGNEAGYQPFLSPADERAAAGLGAGDASALVDALADGERFVKAHVGLTRLSGVEYESFPTWNGLELALHADGDVSIDAEQRARLAHRWRQWLSSDPRPDRLPPA
jgi:hypothetical protein